MQGPKIRWKLTVVIRGMETLLYSRASPEKSLRTTVLHLYALHRGDHGLRTRKRLSQHFRCQEFLGPNGSRYVWYNFRSGNFEATIEQVAVCYKEAGLADVADVTDVPVSRRYVGGVSEWLDIKSGELVLREAKRQGSSAGV